MIRTVLVLVVFSVLCVAQTQGPCHFTSGDFYSYDEVLNCYKSIVLTDEVRYTTLQTLNRSLELYAFYDIAHDSPDPNLPVKVSMQNGLKTIANRYYYYAMDFHDDLRYLYLELRDAHTQYYLPACYQNMDIRQAFAPVAYGSTSSNFTIVVSPFFPDDLLNYYESTYSVDLTKYVNYTISKINGVDAYSYLSQYANSSLGMSKDVGTRLNFVLTVPEPRNDIDIIQYSYWQQRTHRNPFPETSQVIYELIDTKGNLVTLTLPWTFKSTKTYTGYNSFYEDYVNPQIKTSPEELERELKQAAKEWTDAEKSGNIKPSVKSSFMEFTSERSKNIIKEWKQKLIEEHLTEEQQEEYTFELLVNSTHITFWQLSDNKTMVLYLDTMAPGFLSDYYPSLYQGFQVAAQRGLTQLIIDFTNNGGGNICLGRTLLAFLQQEGWPGQGQNWGPQDLPLSQLAEQLINSAVVNDISDTVWSPGFYDNQQNQPIANNDTSYLLPGVSHVRGGLTRNYSKLVHINNCGNYGYDFRPGQNFQPKNVLMITKGFCGSTCALVANHLRLYDGVRVVVLGGMPDRYPMQYSSFPGLQVLDNDPLFGQLVELKQNVSWIPYEQSNDVLPRILPTSSDFRYCIREIYPPEANYNTVPMEYNFQQADYHYYNTPLTSVLPQYFWYYVLDLFN